MGSFIPGSEAQAMWDFAMIALTLALFALAVAYVRACERLR